MKKKSALITGSTSGIGLAIAKELAKQGYNIAINGFGEEKIISSIIDDLRKYSIDVFYSNADMSNQQEIKQMIEEVKEKFSSIDILVNNAGIQYVAPIDEFPEDRWNAIIAINLSSAFLTSKYVLPIMKKNNWGRIINIASAHGKVGSANKSAYVAAKHGVVGLTKVIALETAELNITCNSICPGFVLTDLVQKQIDKIATENHISNDDAAKKLLIEKQPSLQFVKPEDIGSMVVYLCSESAAQITGSEISIDGGWVAR